MQKNISSSNTYLHAPCERCGSKRKVAKRWKEKMPTFTGSTLIEYTQIVCTNKECQAKFEQQMLNESNKRKALKVKKDADDAVRKANSLIQARRQKKNKSRI